MIQFMLEKMDQHINQLNKKLSEIRHKGNMDRMRQSMDAWRKRVATNNQISDIQMATR